MTIALVGALVALVVMVLLAQHWRGEARRWQEAHAAAWKLVDDARVLVDKYEALAEGAVGKYDVAVGQLRDFAERALQMRKEGFEPPPPPAPEPEEPLPAEVEKAIAERAFNPVSERRLRVFARQALTVSEPAQVAADILAGENVEEEL